MALVLIQIVVILILIYQDFRYRSVSVWVLGALAAAAVLNGIFAVGFNQTFFFLSMNLVFLLFILGTLMLYYLLKGCKIRGIFNKYLGLGDVVFFFSLGLMFSPINFIASFVASLLFSLIFTIFVRMFCIKWATIPLVGTMGLFFVPYLSYFILTGASVYSDRELLIYMSSFTQ